MRDQLEYDTFYKTSTWRYGATQPLRELRNLRARGAMPDPPLEKKAALDLGCGLGEYTRALARTGFGRVLGLDFSRTAIELVEQREPKQANVNYLLADFLGVDWEESAYDFVLARGFSLFNTAEIGMLEEVMARFRRLLTPAGSIVITNPNRGGSGGTGWYSWSVREVGEFRVLAMRYFASVDIRFYTRLSRRFFPVLRFNARNAAVLRFLCRLLGRAVVLTIVLRSPREEMTPPSACPTHEER